MMSVHMLARGSISCCQGGADGHPLPARAASWHTRSRAGSDRHMPHALAAVDLAARAVQDAAVYPDTSRLLDQPPRGTLMWQPLQLAS